MITSCLQLILALGGLGEEMGRIWGLGIEGMAREQWVVVVVHNAYVACVLSVLSAFGGSCYFTHLLNTAFAL